MEALAAWLKSFFVAASPRMLTQCASVATRTTSRVASNNHGRGIVSLVSRCHFIRMRWISRIAADAARRAERPLDVASPTVVARDAGAIPTDTSVVPTGLAGVARPQVDAV